jgi:hypothetical protein
MPSARLTAGIHVGTPSRGERRMTGQAVVQTDGTTPERTAAWQPVTGAHLEERSFDVLADARQAAARLLGSEVLAVHERDLLRDVTARIDQTVARQCEQGHIDMEPEDPRERWPEWDFRRDDYRIGEEAARAYRAGG